MNYIYFVLNQKMKEIKLKRQPRWLVRSFMLLWVILWWIFAFVFHPIEWTKADNNKDIVIQVTVTEPGQTLKINKYFSNSFTVNRWEGNTVSLTSDSIHTYNTTWIYNVTLSLWGWYTRWKFTSVTSLIPKNWTTVMNVKIISMPSLAEWFGESATAPGNFFFYGFNWYGALTELPIWSFKTENITSVGGHFFSSFNNNWSLTSLPEWSFDISNISTVGWDFFSSFNNNWSLTSLPEWSFKTENITSVVGSFFSSFNSNWSLTSLPEWSFKTENITSVGSYFFAYFNNNWSLTSLPEWSFNTENIVNTTNGGTDFFNSFNYNWAIQELPHSFKMNSTWASRSNGYENAFNSPNYTINRNVSDLVEWIMQPYSDRNTFSNNQPWRCGVNGYRLDSVANACSDEDCGEWYRGVNNQCVANNAWVYYGNWYIEVRNWDDVVFIADKNVGAATFQSLPEIIRKRNVVWDKWDEMGEEANRDNSLYQDELLDFSYDVLWIEFSNLDDLEGYLDSNNPLSYIINYEIWKLECYQTNEWCTDEEMLYIVNRETGKDFDIEHMSDAWNYVNNYDPYNPMYWEVDDSFWTYFFRWNNNWATREELWVTDDYYANIWQSAYNRWFNGGVMWEDSNNWWIEWNEQDNPCNWEWEYLPTYSDWKNAMEIWATIHWYDIGFNDNGNNWSYYPVNNWNHYSSAFFNDLLIPYAGYIEQYQAPIKSKSLSYGVQTKQKTKLVDFLTMLFSSPVYAMDIWWYDMVFNENLYLHMALDSWNNYWNLLWWQLNFYNLDNESYNNTIAAPVRCFLDHEYVEELKANTTFIIPTDDDFEISVWEETYTELPNTMTVTTWNISEINDEPVYWEVTVDFWLDESAKFSKLVQVKIPVEDAHRVVVKVKHEWSNEYNFDWLTRNRNASCDVNWRPTSSPYKWETITVVNWFATIYTCEASSFIAVWEWPLLAQIILSVDKWELTIWTETWTLDLWQVSVSNNAQEIIGEFGADSFWVEDMKWVESWYYTTISVTDLTWNVASHVISANNISLKTENWIPSLISWADVSEALVVFGDDIKSRHNTWSAPVTYFNREDTPSNLAWRVWKWWDNLQVKVNIPAHTPSDIYRWTITYTLYDLDSQN